MEVAGEVKNTGTATSQFTKVIGTFYDAAGKVIFVDSTFTSPSDIPGGQSSGFKITLNDQAISARISSDAIFAESQQYTSIPELPYHAVIVAGILMSLSVMMLRKVTPQRHTP